MIKILIQVYLSILLSLLLANSAFTLELNYRLIDKPHIKSFIDNQLNSIENKFSNFLIDVIEIDSASSLQVFIKSYNELSVMITVFRNNCIYALLDRPTPTIQQTDSCREISHKLLTQIRVLDDSLLKSITPVQITLTHSKNNIYQSNSYVYLQFVISNIISKLEPNISSVTLVTKSRNEVADQFSLEIGNQLSILHKVIRQVITELVPPTLKRDLESFWLFYINVLQARATANERRDYWAVNVFDLNIKLNEFFYSCERNKKLLSKTSYGLCDDIHKDWNNILRQTLKF